MLYKNSLILLEEYLNLLCCNAYTQLAYAMREFQLLSAFPNCLACLPSIISGILIFANSPFPLIIPKKTPGQTQFIMNLKPLNHFITVTPFKMVNLTMTQEVLRPGMQATLIDLHSAYYHVPLHKRHKRFTRFMWKGTTYEWTCLAFGLGTAPKTFTQVIK